jgi:hypothetical protein
MTEPHGDGTQPRPTETPPGQDEGPGGAEPSTPEELSAEDLALTRRDAVGETRAEPGVGAPTVQQNKRVNALWALDEPRNSWLSFADLGWRKIMPSTESGVVALTMLGAHAKQTQCRVDFSEDGERVVSLYCWG